MKTCNLCQIEKPETEFHRCRNKKDGLQGCCKACNTARVLDYYHKDTNDAKAKYQERAKALRAEYQRRVNEYKAEMGCLFCEDRDPLMLDFHHRDPTQKEACIAQLVLKKSWERIVAEMDKCIVVCCKCHRKIHANRLQVPPEGFEPPSLELKVPNVAIDTTVA